MIERPRPKCKKYVRMSRCQQTVFTLWCTNTDMGGGRVNFARFPHLPAARRRVTEEVIDHVQLFFFHHDKTLLASVIPVHIRRPLNEKWIQIVHPGKHTHTQRVYLYKAVSQTYFTLEPNRHKKKKLKKTCTYRLQYIYNYSFVNGVSSASHLSWGTANQYSGCFSRLPNEWAGLEVMPMTKDFLIGFPTLKQRNIGGFLLFSSDERSMSDPKYKKEKRN